MTDADTKRRDRRISVISTAGRVFSIVAAILAVGRFALDARALLLKYPPVWPDEAVWSDIATGLVRRGVLASNLLSGVLPGIGQHFYFMPPGYFLYLAAVFSVWKPGIIQMRLASVAAALIVMILSYSVGRRTGLGGSLALIVVALVATDSVFLRGALLGRMDMLALAFILAALRLGMTSGSSGAIRAGRLFATGAASAVAGLTHPMGVVAPVTIVATCILPGQGLHRKAMRALLPLLAGMALAVVPWGIYVFKDLSDFRVQMTSQFTRNAKYGSRSALIRDNIRTYAEQYLSVGVQVLPPTSQYPKGLPEAVHGNPWSLLLGPLVSMAGLVGLGLAAKGHPERRGPLVCQSLIVVLLLWGSETWYALYLVPLSAIGLAHLLKVNRRAGLGRVALATLAVLTCAVFVGSNLNRVSRLDYFLNQVYNSRADYVSWSVEISKALPSGSKVLISVIPDPYFGLSDRRDLVLREFFPVTLTTDEQQYVRYMAAADYIIVGRRSVPKLRELDGFSPDPRIDRFVQANGQLTNTVGPQTGDGYSARIYRVVTK